jgi:endonuclease/exonuclease/phosphatase family metal-dependent hydrolase
MTTGPGLTALTRMRRVSRTAEAVRIRLRRAAWLAAHRSYGAARMAAEAEQPLIVAGDFNAAP